MKQTIELFNGCVTMRITIDIEKNVNSSDIYQLMNENQVTIADKLFGIPTAKRDLVRAQRQLERAENAVTYWHARIYELKQKLEQTCIYDGCELTAYQLRLMCDIDIAENTLQRKLELCGKAQEAVQEAEAAYVVDIDTFRCIKIK